MQNDFYNMCESARFYERKKKIKPFSCVLRRTSCLDIHLDSIQFPQCFTGKYNSCKVADFYTEHIYDLRENNKKV